MRQEADTVCFANESSRTRDVRATLRSPSCPPATRASPATKRLSAARASDVAFATRASDVAFAAWLTHQSFGPQATRGNLSLNIDQALCKPMPGPQGAITMY
jgi:hypothetical protein